MAKIIIEIDGKDASIKIDGKEVDNLSGFYADFYKGACRCDGEIENDLFFSYTVKNEDESEFPSNTSYRYVPSKASFEDGKKQVDTRHPSKGDYGRM